MNTHFLRWIRRPSRMLPLALIVSSLGPVQIVQAQIKLAKEKKTLTEYFREIEKQTGYIFLYDQSVSAGIKISLDCSDCTIQQLIAEMTKKSDLEFKISGKQILVKKHKKGAVESKQAIPMTKLDTLVGTVIDVHGTPIQGTTIQVKGTKIGTSSDRMGMFKLQKPVKGAVLVAHAIGYEPQEIELDGQNTVAMRLLSKSILVDEVVVSTGFQKRQRNKMIGNVSSITGADMEMAGVTSIDKALRGKLTGVYVNANSGRPGETGKIMIRGNNTMTGNGEPLFVLDGMPLQTGDVAGIGANNNINSLLTNGIGNIPPEDIASIDILRDATAAAIYGARAANGVIVITTKRGQAGKDYIAYTGRAALVAPPTNHFNFMNSEQKLNYERNLYNDFHPAYGGRANQLLLQVENGTISREEADRQIAELGKTNTNWIDQLYRPALQQTHNITLSGGNTQTQYNVSLNHQDAQGTLIENKFRMSNMNMKLTRNIQDKLLIDLNMYGTLKKNQEGVSNLDPFRYAVFANPYERPYDDQGNYAWDMTYRNLSTNLNNDNPLNYQTFNIIRELRENRMTTDYGNIRATLGLEYKFLKNFRYRANAAIDYTSVTTEDESRAGTYRSFVENWIAKASNLDGTILDKYNLGFFKENSGKTTAYTVRNTLEYNQTFSNKHFIQAFVANEVSDKINKRFNHNNPIYLQDYRMTGYPSWDVIPKEVYNRLQLETLGGTFFEEDREVSFISSLVYAYDNRYVVNANFRSDGVDIIGSKNQFTPLWSAGLKWNAHEEDFVKNRFAWLNRFVLSAGYGYTGSINRSIYPFHTYTLSAQMYGNVVTASQFNFGNPVLKWEKKRDLDLGVQLSLLNSRLNMEANYYDNKVTDLLDEIELPISVGRASAKVNNGILTNKGWELSARIEVVKNTDWIWEIGANLTTVKNKLLNVYKKDLPFVGNRNTENIEGYAMGSWFGYKFSHVDPTNGHLMAYAQRRNEADAIIGTELIDLSAISETDLQLKYSTFYLGTQTPSTYGGFNTRLHYKNVDFTANFMLGSGNKLLGFMDRREGPSGETDDVTAGRTNRLQDQQYRWRQPGDQTDIPVYQNKVANYNRYILDNDLENANYIRCTELGFMYRISPEKLQNSIFSQVKFGLFTNNLFTLTSYSGSDPEAKLTFGYPLTRSYNFSVSVNF